MTPRWYPEMDTILSALGLPSRNPDGDGVPVPPCGAGCLCPECSELRRAVGGGRRMNKEIARLQQAKAEAKAVNAEPPAPAPDPVAEIRAVLAEPLPVLPLPDRRLPPGDCRGCRGPGAVQDGWCVYCVLLRDEQRAAMAASPARPAMTGDLAGWVVMLSVLILLFWTVVGALILTGVVS